MLLALLVVILSSCNSSDAPEAELPEYEVLAQATGDEGDPIVLVDEEGVTSEDLANIAEIISDEEDAERVGFQDYVEFVGAGYSLGYWEEDDVSNLREKDWSDRPTQEEVDIWAAWGEEVDQLYDDVLDSEDPTAPVDEGEATRTVAVETGQSEEEVDEATTKVAIWLAD